MWLTKSKILCVGVKLRIIVEIYYYARFVTLALNRENSEKNMKLDKDNVYIINVKLQLIRYY